MARERCRRGRAHLTAWPAAARNTGIPFVLLKHRVLTQGQTLSEAIRVSKPDLDAVAAMDRARTDARSALTRLGN